MEPGSEKDNTAIIDRVKKWVEEFVIALNLCPFASHPFQKNTIKYAINLTNKNEDWIHSFIKECNSLIESTSDEVSTSLLIFTSGMEDFLFFLDIVETFDQMLIDSNLHAHIQLAHFHPDYQFEATEADDVTNYTNRSPLPIIQLLRSEEIEMAISNYETEEIPIKNMEKMKELGIEEIKKRMR